MFDEFYGLRGSPFQLTPDPAFFYESLTQRKALSYLSYGLAQGEGFIVITGDIGAGKSTLVAYLMATIDRSRLTAAQVVTSKLDGEEMVQVVAHAFGLMMAGHDKTSALAAIEAFLHTEARAGRRCLLVVDESQHLSVEALEELRMLSNFQLGSHPLLQILLLGQPEFRANIQGHPQLEQLRQRVIAAHHLDPMEAAEIEPYIIHRLRLVGWNGNPAFDQRVFREIYTATGGVPRRINMIVNRLLILGGVEQRRRIDGVMLAQVIGEMTADGALQLAPRVSAAEETLRGLGLGKDTLGQNAGGQNAGGQNAAPHGAPSGIPAANAVSANAADAEAATGARAAVLGRIGASVQARAEGKGEPAWTEALALRDGHIAELQQAVVELANMVDAQGEEASAGASLEDRIAAIEQRMIEQDRTIRHTLTMLIEWIERDAQPRAAA